MRTLSKYIYDLPNWPNLKWDQHGLSALLAAVRHEQGRLLGQMEGLGLIHQQEAALQMLTQEVIKSSEIEGEKLNPDMVRSSIARRLGLDYAGLPKPDRFVDGMVEMMIDATHEYTKPLTAERLFGWHAALFPTGRSGMRKISVGEWRDDKKGPMQVVSGPVGKEHVHYQAPPAAALNEEMAAFLTWFEEKDGMDAVAKAGLAHMWFVTIHPFDDGNGRIARAIADMTLARSERSAQRFYSMSAQIQKERDEYYGILERTQKGTLDVTPWMTWFLECLNRAIAGTKDTLIAVMHKAKFWESVSTLDLNERQRRVLNMLLDRFDGKLTSSKWAKLTKVSHDTALRDIKALEDRGILVREAAGGRSTSYTLAPPKR